MKRVISSLNSIDILLCWVLGSFKGFKRCKVATVELSGHLCKLCCGGSVELVAGQTRQRDGGSAEKLIRPKNRQVSKFHSPGVHRAKTPRFGIPSV